MVKALKGKGTYCVESWEILVKIWNLQKKMAFWKGNILYLKWKKTWVS